MPPIPNWTRLDESESQYARENLAAWQNDVTQDIVYLTTKVPNDGYYGMRVEAEEADGMMGHRIAYHHRRRDAYQKTTSWMREHQEGGY